MHSESPAGSDRFLERANVPPVGRTHRSNALPTGALGTDRAPGALASALAITDRRPSHTRPAGRQIRAAPSSSGSSRSNSATLLMLESNSRLPSSGSFDCANRPGRVCEPRKSAASESGEERGAHSRRLWQRSSNIWRKGTSLGERAWRLRRMTTIVRKCYRGGQCSLLGELIEDTAVRYYYRRRFGDALAFVDKSPSIHVTPCPTCPDWPASQSPDRTNLR
jgi:hypothetical protein